MIEKAKNKMVKKFPNIKIKFHFSGEGKYYPMMIEATDYQEALKIWKQKRSEIKNK